MNSIRDHILTILDSSQPLSVQVLQFSNSDGQVESEIDMSEFAASWLDAHPECQLQKREISNTDFPFSSKVDLVLINNTLEFMSLAEGKTLLGQIRNFGALHIAVLVDDNSAWSFNDFISLGFRKQQEFLPECDQSRSYTLYTYNLDSYNHKRTWNNARFWANPDMWNKSRW